MARRKTHLAAASEKEANIKGFLTTDQIAATAGCWRESDSTVSGYFGAFHRD